MADIGASTTELAVFFEGSVAHTAVLPVGGRPLHQRPGGRPARPRVEEAEYLKRTYRTLRRDGGFRRSNEIEVGRQPGDGQSGVMGSQARLRSGSDSWAEILEPRARELFTMMRDNLRAGRVCSRRWAPGCVLTGGGAMMSGLLDNAESLLRVPARVGHPVPLSRMPEELARPEVRGRDRDAALHAPDAGAAGERGAGAAGEAEGYLCGQLLGPAGSSAGSCQATAYRRLAAAVSCTGTSRSASRGGAPALYFGYRVLKAKQLRSGLPIGCPLPRMRYASRSKPAREARIAKNGRS